jgi:hydroxymethylpyrimidine pyrophosphatase-like HAD family hydrolase
VTANGAYVADGKGQIIYDKPLPETVVTNLVTWLERSDVDHVFYGSDAVVASKWTDLMSDAITPVYGKLSVDPDFIRLTLFIRC